MLLFSSKHLPLKMAKVKQICRIMCCDVTCKDITIYDHSNLKMVQYQNMEMSTKIRSFLFLKGNLKSCYKLNY